MENGKVYWSNWFGLDGLTKNIQVQRGLGASKLALPSVGGTINILIHKDTKVIAEAYIHIFFSFVKCDEKNNPIRTHQIIYVDQLSELTPKLKVTKVNNKTFNIILITFCHRK